MQASQWRFVPVTTALIAASFAGFALVYYLGSPGLVSWFTFLPFSLGANDLQFGDMGLQYWRLVTPAFLHFGWLHIVFNSLWLWDLGSRLELLLGRVNLLLLVLVIAMVSNISQYYATGPSLFGGMSGVVFGLLGFSWVAPLVQPTWPSRSAGWSVDSIFSSTLQATASGGRRPPFARIYASLWIKFD